MRVRLVEDDLDQYAEDDVNDIVAGNVAPSQEYDSLQKRCRNITFPENYDWKQEIDKRIKGNSPFSTPIGKFLIRLNAGHDKLKVNSGPSDIMSLFGNNKAKFVEFLNELETSFNLKNLDVFIPYKNCFNLNSNPRAYVLKVIDSWFDEREFRKFFSNIIASDTGAEELENKNRQLEQDDFNALFVLNQNTLKPSGYPKAEDDLKTIYGTIEHLSALHDANLPNNKEDTDIDTILRQIKALKAAGKTKDLKAIKNSIE